MVFPFTRHHQVETSHRLAAEIRQGRPAVVHVVCFPSLALNHVLVLFDLEETSQEIRFSAYDPNQPDLPSVLVFDRRQRTFTFPPNRYFVGGAVNVYEIYQSGLY
jgi:hypothetical protein